MRFIVNSMTVVCCLVLALISSAQMMCIFYKPLAQTPRRRRRENVYAKAGKGIDEKSLHLEATFHENVTISPSVSPAVGSRRISPTNTPTVANREVEVTTVIVNDDEDTCK